MALGGAVFLFSPDEHINHRTQNDNVADETQDIRRLFEYDDADNGGIEHRRIEKDRYVSGWGKFVGECNAELPECCKQTCQKQKDKLLPRHRLIEKYEKRQKHDR